jgi:hypothetical protein
MKIGMKFNNKNANASLDPSERVSALIAYKLLREETLFFSSSSRELAHTTCGWRLAGEREREVRHPPEDFHVHVK